MRTRFTELVGVEHPLAGFNRSPAVAAAVTDAGGLGVLAATAYTPAADIARAIVADCERRLRQLTSTALL
jgi:NAD(P)H-dependent flavin oxidoreductase YrpB (nitropropane dioxygenase family)